MVCVSGLKVLLLDLIGTKLTRGRKEKKKCDRGWQLARVRHRVSARPGA